MKIEKLEVSNRKNVLIFISGFMLAILIVILVNYLTSRANYRNTQSIDLAKGTINYKVPDLNVLAINVQQGEDGPYQKSNTIPIGNYIINATESYCVVGTNKNHINNITYNYDNKTGTLGIEGITQTSTKCYLIFDVDNRLLSDKTLAKLEQISGSEYEIKEEITFSETSSSTAKEVYRFQDNDGDTYVFRGNPDNWVTFAGKTWRIIRINGDGTLRLLYYCGSTSCSSSENAVESNVYNSSKNNNTYVGFYYGDTNGNYEQTHSNKTPSTIATELKSWYQDNLETSYKDYLSETTGWCNDRQLSSGTGAGATQTFYVAYARLTNNGSAKTPVTPKLTCGSRDLFTIPNDGKVGNQAMTLKTTSENYVPIGLITADEAAIGGLLYSSSANKNSYVSPGTATYWTISPYGFSNGYAFMFTINSSGYLAKGDGVGSGGQVRPVINVDLNKINDITGTGTSESRFIIT